VAGDSAGPRTSHVSEEREDTVIGRLGRVVDEYYLVFCVFYIVHLFYF